MSRNVDIVFRLAYSYANSSTPEELHATILMYERPGYFDEVLSLLEGGLSLERAHVFVFISYARTILNISADGDIHGAHHVM